MCYGRHLISGSKNWLERMTWESADPGAIEHGCNRTPNKHLLQALLTMEPDMRCEFHINCGLLIIDNSQGSPKYFYDTTTRYSSCRRHILILLWEFRYIVVVEI